MSDLEKESKEAAKFLGELMATMTHEVALLTAEIAGAMSDVAAFGENIAACKSAEDAAAGVKALRDRADSMQRQLLATTIKLSKVGGGEGVNIIPFPTMPKKDR